MRAPTQRETWHEPALLPNCDGFRFVALTKYGEREAAVKRGDDGMHRVVGVPFAAIIGWRCA